MIGFAKLYFLIFGILTVAGGVMGFVTKSSTASLIAGGISGALLILAYAMPASKLLPALILGLVVSILLAGRFAPVFIKTGSFMPAGLMTILSVAGVIIGALALIKR